MRFTRLLAFRYAFGRGKKGAVALISRFAAFVVGVAVFAFFIVLAVFGGLREFGLTFTHAFDPDIVVEKTQEARLSLNDSVLAPVYEHPEVDYVSATLSQKMMLRFGDQTAFAKVIGVDSLFTKVVDGETMVGEWVQPNAHELVLGIGVLTQLDGAAFDHPEGVTLLVPNKRGQSVLNQQPFRTEKALVRGVFQLGESVDETVAFAPLGMLHAFLRIPSTQADALYLKLSAGADARAIRRDLAQTMGAGYRVRTKAELNPALYKMLQTERVAVIAILTLVLIIALFNVVGAIIMTLLEKKENIKTLYSLGAPLASLRRVFFAQGVLLTASGGFTGLLLAFVLVLLQKNFSLVTIPGAYLAYPVALEWSSLWIIIGLVGGLGGLVAWLTSGVVKSVVKR
jgi:lipoprotein-releasing system permease protein